MHVLSALSLSLVLFTIFQSANAELVLSAPPRETEAAGKEFYGTIADSLTTVLGEKVSYSHPQNWIDYAKEMRAEKYDIIFDGPHFVAWRMKHIEHVPVARLSGELQFYVLAMKSDTQLNNMRDVLGSGLCGPALPNLATLSAYNLYRNPFIQPEIHNVNGGMKKLIQLFFNKQCRAVVVRDQAYGKLDADKKARVKIIAKSKKMPNQTISVSKKIAQAKLDKIKTFFLSKDGAQAAENLLHRFSKNDKKFIDVNLGDYLGLEDLLEGAVFGW